jgi:predicted nuclease with TOPRIM domain
LSILLVSGGFLCYNWNVPKTNNVMTIEEIKKFEERVARMEKLLRPFLDGSLQKIHLVPAKLTELTEELAKLTERVKKLEEKNQNTP